jgi:hypothetical protein
VRFFLFQSSYKLSLQCIIDRSLFPWPRLRNWAKIRSNKENQEKRTKKIVHARPKVPSPNL